MAAPEKLLTNEQLLVVGNLINRSLLAKAMGTQFDGMRDLYGVLGYPVEITSEQYVEKYHRQDIAGKVVDLPAQDTWRKPPVIHDGDSLTSEEQPVSKFIQSMKFLIEKRKFWHYLSRVDRLSGIGRYGVLLLGVTGNGKLDEELKKGELKAVQDLIYFSPFSEQAATIQLLEQDTGSPRFRLPKTYTIKMGENLPSASVHWSRVIHVAEDLEEDEIYGRPRLERVYNRLNDLIKIVGGGAEAAWKNMDRGLHADVREGFDLDAIDAENLSDEIDEYIHGMRRFLRTKGVDVNALGSDVPDIQSLFQSTIGLISAASDIPQRILLGSERGELASSQDEAAWAGVIASRQTQHAEPDILRPVIDRLITYGALPAPTAGEYSVEWPSLFELDEKEKAGIADTYASAIQKVAPAGAPDLVITPMEFRIKFLGMPAMDPEAEMLDEEDGDREPIAENPQSVSDGE